MAPDRKLVWTCQKCGKAKADVKERGVMGSVMCDMCWDAGQAILRKLGVRTDAAGDAAYNAIMGAFHKHAGPLSNENYKAVIHRMMVQLSRLAKADK